MNVKKLAAMCACVAAFGVGVGVAPAAAKTDKNPLANGKGWAKGKFKHCETGAKRFRCVTDDGETTSGQCPSDYTVISSITAGVEGVDVNGDGFVCYSAELGYVDDRIL